MTEKNDNILEISNLHVLYQTDEEKVYAINDLNLSVKRGETLGLVGETGAGKTTTALSIMRLLPDRIGQVTKGSIILDDIDILNVTESKMRSIRGDTISMIFQDPMTSLNPVLTVGDQIKEVLEIHKSKMTGKELSDKVDEILELVGIPFERKDNYPHQFSGGMKQRIIIAIALACEPKLLLADEPTTALDVTIQAQVIEMMIELKDKLNTSMILITHDLGVVAEMCDRVAIMYAGEIIEIGSLEDIFENEDHHPYTVGLFNSIPDMTKTTRRLKPIKGLMPDPTFISKGCPFEPRCPKSMEICKNEKPNLILNSKHGIKCHLFNDISKGEKNE